MGTPNFANIAPIARSTFAATDSLATDPQLGFIDSLVTEREWANTGLAASWVRRIASIAITLRIAAEVTSGTDEGRKVADHIDIVLDDDTDRFTTFHQLMQYNFDAAVADERDPMDSKPLTKAGASALIDVLSKLGKKASAPAAAPVADTNGWVSADVVPAGRYAVETEDGATNGLAFYKVDRPTEGRWAGYTFVKLMVSDDEQRLPIKTQQAVLRKIAAAGAAAASARYGQEIGTCGVCSRTLTNDDSRAYGIGPDCRKKLGW
ncbi:hypothetical protein I5G59_gp43 [Mycobacterium phage LilMcDreamy]|uniref:Uncharacterized protein n=1 Tax=Mycobacterium phage LilMcDreamy TaxID=2652422 RepID=A0A5P8D6J8_9CAUD|nr:hypothetical protein I5G59_gp43 [Mycobacterium phage LilMcDreamy]QFP94663.1 hypothetical protein SEA_LILMCDREAMY_43 [Mycobacterium phage LilMcDreamy]